MSQRKSKELIKTVNLNEKTLSEDDLYKKR